MQNLAWYWDIYFSANVLGAIKTPLKIQIKTLIHDLRNKCTMEKI